MNAYIDPDEILVTATIPAAAGKKVTITALPEELRYPSVIAEFNQDGELVSDSWPIGVLLRCGSEQIVDRGSLGSVVAAMYQFTFKSQKVDDFTVRLPGVGGGIVDVSDLGDYDGENAYAFPVESFSDTTCVVDATDEESTERQCQ